MKTIQTDERSRVALTGHPNQLFIMNDLGDGSILLSPATVISDAQQEYNENPALQELLTRAQASPVRHERRSRSDGSGI